MREQAAAPSAMSIALMRLPDIDEFATESRNREVIKAIGELANDPPGRDYSCPCPVLTS